MDEAGASYASRAGSGDRAPPGNTHQALGEEHVKIARMNLDYALDKSELAAKTMPGIKLVIENSGSRR